MTSRNSVHVACSVLALLVVAAGPVNIPKSEVLTLISPNEESFGGFGEVVASAGDINQDGFEDVIVGASQEEPGTSPNWAGRAYVFSGPDGSLLFELVSPNEQENGFFGYCVAGAGDVNGDGVADLIVGARGEDPGNSPGFAGRAYIFSGQNGSLLFELVSPNEQLGGQFGWSVAGAGDVNKDGHRDAIVGAWREDPGNSPTYAGRAYVFSGQDGSLLFELMSPKEQEQGLFGYSVAGAGDVNQDGSRDLVVGAGGEDPGRAYVFSGQDGSVLFELVSPNPQGDGGFGASVAGAGDLNQDGFADLIVGAPGEDAGPEAAGRGYVFSGQDGSLLFQLVSPNRDEYGLFGSSVASGGDVSRDGLPDVIVGAPWEDPGNPLEAGRAYAFSGRDGTLLFQLASPNEERIGHFGESVAGAGDANQDGVPDVIVGAPGESPGTSPDYAGRAYVVLSPFPSPGASRINSGGRSYTDAGGNLFAGDRPYEPSSFGYVGGRERRFDQPIGGTDDDPLYQDLRLPRDADPDGIFAYRFDVAPATYDVTLYLMAPALEGAGNVVMDVQAEGDVIFDDLDVTAEAGGEFEALVKTFAVDVNDGTLDLRFRAVNKAAVVSAIAVVQQAGALSATKDAAGARRLGRRGAAIALKQARAPSSVSAARYSNRVSAR